MRTTRKQIALGIAAATTSTIAILTVGALPASSTENEGQSVTPQSFGTILDHITINTNSDRATDVLTVAVTLAPGGTTGWHTHPGPVAVIIDSGVGTLYHASGNRCPHTQVRAGRGFFESGRADHVLVNETNQPLELHATFFLPNGAPPVVDAPRPAACAGIG